MSTITYELKNGFEYANKGNQETASFIELSAPTTKNLKECSILKQSFFKSVKGLIQGQTTPADSPKQDGDMELLADEIMLVMSGSADVELSMVLATARELFTSGIALVDGEQKFTKPLADLMSMRDLENMTGEYLANFILASS